MWLLPVQLDLYMSLWWLRSGLTLQGNLHKFRVFDFYTCMNPFPRSALSTLCLVFYGNYIESSRIILWPLLTLCFKPKPSRRSRKFSSTVLPFDLSGWPMQPAYHQRAARSVAPAGAKQQNSYQFLSMSSLLPTQNSYHHEFIAPHHHLYTPLKSKKKNMVAELTNLENYCCWKPNTETGWIATSFLLWSD